MCDIKPIEEILFQTNFRFNAIGNNMEELHLTGDSILQFDDTLYDVVDKGFKLMCLHPDGEWKVMEIPQRDEELHCPAGTTLRVVPPND